MSNQMILETIIRSVLAVIVGIVIGSERARHGRAAGMRTHILVCLGSCLTALTGVFVAKEFGFDSGAVRLSAQVISGVGFLGAGMIILKNNMVTGLTTAAGVWATATIGIALGYGYYAGAIVVTVLFMATIVSLTRFEKMKSIQGIYVELDDQYRLNEFINLLNEKINDDYSYQIGEAKSMNTKHIGIHLAIKKEADFDYTSLTDIEYVIFSVEEN